MKLFIIRHAQSANNVLEAQDYDYYMRNRVVDPTITEIGFQQVDRLAGYFEQTRATIKSNGNGNDDHLASHYEFTHLYCSPMLRTLQTARPISQAMGLTPEVWVDIHEQGGMFLGNPRNNEELVGYPGMTRHEIAASFPDYVIPPTVSEQGWWTTVYEDHDQCKARAARVAEELHVKAKAMPDARIAIVSHGTFADRLVKVLTGTTADSLYFHHHNTAITRLDFWSNGNVSLRYLNRIHHLPHELITA